MNEKKIKEFVEGMKNGAEIALTCSRSFKVLFRCLKEDFLFFDGSICIAAGNGESNRTLGINFQNVTVSTEEEEVLKITDNNGNELEMERF